MLCAFVLCTSCKEHIIRNVIMICFKNLHFKFWILRSEILVFCSLHLCSVSAFTYKVSCSAVFITRFHAHEIEFMF